MQGKHIERIVVVGGGTAGWMSAVYLKTTFGSSVRVTLVESPKISTVGVGEASFNTIKLFFDAIGLSEDEWMPECSATYKLAIKFINWRSDGLSFFHPFQRFEHVDGSSLAEWWLKYRETLGAFDSSCFAVPALCDANRSPKYLDGRPFDQRIAGYVPYAYHFDATLLASYLQNIGIARGVEHFKEDVQHVSVSENGLILSVETASQRSIPGELFIDCSGFLGLLINKTLREPFIPFRDSLLCDCAVAMRVPSDSKTEGIEPYTTATAFRSGWCWRIPLFHRIGTGYVYSSSFASKDEAERDLRAHTRYPRDSELQVSHIKMRIGRTRNAWVGNCVAIGLAGGFVEPLESTGIFFIQYALSELVNHFPDNEYDEAIAANYNRVVASCIDAVRDFLTLYYCVTQRTDSPFWLAARNELKLSERVREMLSVWRIRLPNSSNVPEHYHGFIAYSYCVIMLGLQYVPNRPCPLVSGKESLRARERFGEIAHDTTKLISSLPSHYEYVARLHARDFGRPACFGASERWEAADSRTRATVRMPNDL